MIFTLDTNVLVDALRQPGEMDRLKAFLAWALPDTVLSSVVVAELSRGARTDAARRALDESLLAPFGRRGRIVAPSTIAWRRTGMLLGHTRLATTLSASQQNDALLAAEARERGWAIVTRDRDLWILRQRISGLQVVAPYPNRT